MIDIQLWSQQTVWVTIEHQFINIKPNILLKKAVRKWKKERIDSWRVCRHLSTDHQENKKWGNNTESQKWKKTFPLIPQLFKSFQTGILLLSMPSNCWWDREGVWGGVWSPPAIHVHLGAHLPYGDLEDAAHMWFQLSSQPRKCSCTSVGTGGWEWGRGCTHAGRWMWLRWGIVFSSLPMCMETPQQGHLFFTSQRQIRQKISSGAGNELLVGVQAGESQH